jgi:hypothetical protein
MKVCARTQTPTLRQRSSDFDEDLRRRTRQGWHRGKSPNEPPIASHRTPPGPATAASTSQQQKSRGKLTNTPEKSRLSQPEPRLRHRSTPSSLPQKPQHKHLANHCSRLPMYISKHKASKEEYDTRVPPMSDHKDQGFPPELHHRSIREEYGSKTAMPPRRSTTATATAIASPAENRDRVFTQLHTLCHRHRQAHQPPPPPTNLPAGEAPLSAAYCRR